MNGFLKASGAAESPLYRFGPFRVDSRRRRLERNGQAVPLAPKVFDTLLTLLQRAGEVIDKDELMKSVWPDTFVEEDNLTHNISALRKALGDSSGQPYILTLPRQGYRFVAPVEVSVRPASSPWSWIRRLLPPVTAGGALLIAAAVGYIAHLPAEPRPPEFQPLTFRNGMISAARFAADSKSIVYSAIWNGEPQRVFSTRPESQEALMLPLPSAGLLDVSEQGELLLTMLGDAERTVGVVPLNGSAPRRLFQDVSAADWGPDGKSVALVRRAAGRDQLEYPVGTVLHSSGTSLSYPRISPSGDSVAFIESSRTHGSTEGRILLVDKSRRYRELSGGWGTVTGIAWSADGDEIWFTAALAGAGAALHAVNRSGRVRLVETGPGELRLHDISNNGDMLLAREAQRSFIRSLGPSDTTERDLSWLDYSRARDLSSDGRLLLCDETGAGGGPLAGLYLRTTDGAAPIRLGGYSAFSLSPDLHEVLATDLKTSSQLVVLPIGAGASRTLENSQAVAYQAAAWLPDKSGVLFIGITQGRGPRYFLRRFAEREDRPLDAEGHPTRGIALMRSGTGFVARNSKGDLTLYSTRGESPQAVRGALPGDVPIKFDTDDRTLFVLESDGATPWIFPPAKFPARVVQLDWSTGDRRLWREFRPIDPAAVAIGPFVMTPDGRFYAYSYLSITSELYIVRGLH